MVNRALDIWLQFRCSCADISLLNFTHYHTDHMAKIKDRLIFETKKMEAVERRKSNKEQTLMAKERHAHRLAEKAKQKKAHMSAVSDWRTQRPAKESRARSGTMTRTASATSVDLARSVLRPIKGSGTGGSVEGSSRMMRRISTPRRASIPKGDSRAVKKVHRGAKGRKDPGNGQGMPEDRTNII